LVDVEKCVKERQSSYPTLDLVNLADGDNLSAGLPSGRFNHGKRLVLSPSGMGRFIFFHCCGKVVGKSVF
jgi:hypothetical protein